MTTANYDSSLLHDEIMSAQPDSSSQTTESPTASKTKSKLGPIILGIIVVLAVILVGVHQYKKNKKKETPYNVN